MKKEETDKSEFKAHCEIFNTEATVKLEKTPRGKRKVLISLKDEETDEKTSLYLHSEDVKKMSNFLDTIIENCEPKG